MFKKAYLTVKGWFVHTPQYDEKVFIVRDSWALRVQEAHFQQTRNRALGID
jgi:hypothetical protein